MGMKFVRGVFQKVLETWSADNILHVENYIKNIISRELLHFLKILDTSIL